MNLFLGGQPSTSLLKVNLTLVTTAECNVKFESSRKVPYGLLDSQLCAGDANGEKDTCQVSSHFEHEHYSEFSIIFSVRFKGRLRRSTAGSSTFIRWPPRIPRHRDYIFWTRLR